MAWGLLAAFYAFCVLMADFGRAKARCLFSLEGVMTIFDYPWPTMAGWLHYLCFDSFARAGCAMRARGGLQALADLTPNPLPARRALVYLALADGWAHRGAPPWRDARIVVQRADDEAPRRKIASHWPGNHRG